jgi:hypothetical protein
LKRSRTGTKPVPPPAPLKRTEDIRDIAFWGARLKIVHPHNVTDLFLRFGEDKVREGAKRVPAYHWEDMPGPETGDKMDQAEARMMSYNEFVKLLESL